MIFTLTHFALNNILNAFAAGCCFVGSIYGIGVILQENNRLNRILLIGEIILFILNFLFIFVNHT